MFAFANGINPTATQELPFTVHIASACQIKQAVDLRAERYSWHQPEVGALLQVPEPEDHEPGCEVFIVSSKLDGQTLATLRAHTNALKPLPLEASIALPADYAGQRLVEVTRLAVAAGAGSVARDALFKALFIRCQQLGVARFVITSRHPVDRMYQKMGFRDVFGNCVHHMMSHVDGMPLRVMTLPIDHAFSQLPVGLHNFMFHTRHPDILIDHGTALWATSI